MEKISKYINERFNPNWDYVIEIATIGHPIFNKIKYSIATYGTQLGDRNRPHIYIYLNDDKRPFSKFNFEIVLDEILCYDEINLIRMKDLSKHIDKTNRTKCSWEGYNKLHDDFEDWLYSNKVDISGEYIDNLDALIYFYNQESGGETNDYNPLLEYIKSHGLVILNKFKQYFNIETINNYNNCFK